MAKKYQSDIDKLFKSNVAIENSFSNPEINQHLTEIGYGAEKREEGRALLNKARQAYDFNKIRNNETSIAHMQFTDEKKVLFDLYRKHRRIAKILFEGNTALCIQLRIDKPASRVYLEWLDLVKAFYTVLLSDDEAQQSFAAVKILPQELQSTYLLITKVEKLRETHRNAKAESQNATQLKNKSLKELELWMRNFYNYAKIALMDSPQLMECLGKKVKS